LLAESQEAVSNTLNELKELRNTGIYRSNFTRILRICLIFLSSAIHSVAELQKRQSELEMELLNTAPSLSVKTAILNEMETADQDTGTLRNTILI